MGDVTKTEMTAERIVAIARRAAPYIFQERYSREQAGFSAAHHVNVYEWRGASKRRDEFTINFTDSPASEAIMSAPLTPENIASPLALAWALVESRITVEKAKLPARHGFWALLASKMGWGATEAEACTALLDALFASAGHDASLDARRIRVESYIVEQFEEMMSGYIGEGQRDREIAAEYVPKN